MAARSLGSLQLHSTLPELEAFWGAFATSPQSQRFLSVSPVACCHIQLHIKDTWALKSRRNWQGTFPNFPLGSTPTLWHQQLPPCPVGPCVYQQ